MTGIYSLLEGRTLSGRYQIGRMISKGGMGAVFRATDLRLGRSVAVKVIAIEPENPEQAVRLQARFRREAHAAAKLRHPHIVTLYDFGNDETTGLDFIVMELLEGEDLLRRVSRTGPLPWRQASRILYEAARGLGAGHRAGLVHRDVKPANLFLECDADGKPRCTRVLDFGIAQLTAEGTATATHLTVLGQAPLSPAYASPEQQRGERELTPAADVWGLGVTAFQILTGTLPFSEDQRAALINGARIRPPSVSSLNPTVPASADELICRTLSERPSARPPDGDAFAREISAMRRTSRPAVVPEIRHAEVTTSAAQGLRRTRKSLLKPAAIVAGVFLMAWWIVTDQRPTAGFASGADTSDVFIDTAPIAAAPAAGSSAQVLSPEPPAARPDAATNAQVESPKAEGEVRDAPAPSDPPSVFDLRAVISDPDGYTNVRSTKSTAGAIVARVEDGEEFSTYSQEGRWWRVKTRNGTVGYMHISRIRIIQ